jgi:hypothetical protein
MPEPFMNRQDVKNVLHRPFGSRRLAHRCRLLHSREVDHPTSVAGDQFAVADERAALVRYRKNATI